jgi:hypothetical protein
LEDLGMVYVVDTAEPKKRVKKDKTLISIWKDVPDKQMVGKNFYDALDRVAKMESAKIDQKYIYDMLNEAVEEYNIATARTTDIPTFSGPYFPPKGKVLWLIFFRYFLLIALGILLTLAYFKFFYVIHTNVLGDLVLTRKW